MAETQIPKAGYTMELKIGGQVAGAAGDLKLSLTRKPMDASSRAGLGHKSFIPGMLNWNLSGNAVYMHADPALLLLLDTGKIKKTVLPMIILDLAGYGFSGNVLVKTYKETESLNDAVKCQLAFQGTGQLTRVTPQA